MLGFIPIARGEASLLLDLEEEVVGQDVVPTGRAQVQPKPGLFSASEFHPAVGVGPRYKFNRRENLNFGVSLSRSRHHRSMPRSL